MYYEPPARKTFFTAKRVRALGGKAAGFLSVTQMPPRARSAILKAIKTGMMNTRYGAAADFLTVVREATGLPTLVTSATSGYRGFIIFNAPLPDQPGADALIEALGTWWTADRVLFRMGDPGRYAEYTRPSTPPYFAEMMKMPRWAVQMTSSFRTVSSRGLDPAKEVKSYLPIATALTKTEGYAAAAERAWALLAAPGPLEVQLR